jgi:SPP1 gp7 family putative phage head morphogenesis protein
MNYDKFLYETIGSLANGPDGDEDLSILPPVDDLFKKLGKFDEVWEKIIREPKVLSLIEVAYTQVCNIEYRLPDHNSAELSGMDKEAADFTAKYLKKYKMHFIELIWGFYSTKYSGCKVQEIVYQDVKWDGKNHIIPAKIVEISPQRIVFDTQFNPRILTKKQPEIGELLSDYPYKFIITTHLSNNLRPYGVSIFSSLYWIIVLKYNGLKALAKLVEAFSKPWVIAKYREGTNDTLQKKLRDELTKMVDNSIAVIPNGAEIEFREAKNNGQLSLEEIRYLDNAISVLLNRESLISNFQEGSFAAVEGHLTSSQEFILHSILMHNPHANIFLENIVALNYPGANAPQNLFILEDKPNKEWADFFTTTKSLIGKTTPISFVHEKTGVPMAKEGEATLVDNRIPNETNESLIGKKNDHEPMNSDGVNGIGEKQILTQKTQKSFSANPDKNLLISADSLEQLAFKGGQEAESLLPLGEIAEVLDDVTNLEEFQGNLAKLYQQLDKKKLIKKLEQGLLIGGLVGIWEMKQPVDNFNFNTQITLNELPFDEAVDYLQQKIKIPTQKWNDLQAQQHDWAFVVAGVTQTELLNDLHVATLKALKNGETIQDFRKNFDQIVAKHGWGYKGERGWRTNVIFDTQMSTARAAGHWDHIMENVETRPYLRYVTVGDNRVRPNHRMLSGTTRPVKDAFWDFHSPPLGYRCRCKVISLDGEQMTRQRFRVTPQTEIRKTLNNIGYRIVIDPVTGQKKQLNKAITPGFDYKPGASVQKERMIQQTQWKLPPELKKQLLDELKTA